jgi:hypothetical protein
MRDLWDWIDEAAGGVLAFLFVAVLATPIALVIYVFPIGAAFDYATGSIVIAWLAAMGLVWVMMNN